jgi:hypothetical protein
MATISVPASTTSTPVFASGAGVDGRVVFNDSTAVLYLKFGTSASTSDYTVQIPADGYYEFPQPLYTGEVDGLWASANGFARTTEW